MKLPFLILLAILFCGKGNSLFALSPTSAKTDSSSIALVPGAGYDSNNGFGVAALFQKITYNSNWEPYKKAFRLQGGATSQGKFSVKSEFEQRFSNQARLSITIFGERVERAYFFGIGSNTSFNSSLWDEQFYNYERWYGLIHSELAIPLHKNRPTNTYWLINTDIQYLSADAREDNLFFMQPPNSRLKGWANRIGGGIYVDYRDNPFRTKEGYQLKMTSSIAPYFVGNKTNYGQIKAIGSYYTTFHFIHEITFASRARYWQTIGDAPFFDLPFLGGQYDLRGFPLERFRDKGAVSYNLELRTWLFNLPFWEIEAGGQLFFDGGWIFDHPYNFQLQQMKWNVGFGGIASVFKSDFLIRADIGLSSEIWRLSIGLGYLF